MLGACGQSSWGSLCVVLVVVYFATGTLRCSMDEDRARGVLHLWSWWCTYGTSNHCLAHLLICLVYVDRCAPFGLFFCRKNGVQIQSRVQGGSSWA